VFFNKGLVFEKMNNMKEAVRFYKKAISLNPNLVLFFNKKKQLIKDGVWDKINEREES
jgi:tetratricopeptide (TPR) repeat protein